MIALLDSRQTVIGRSQGDFESPFLTAYFLVLLMQLAVDVGEGFVPGFQLLDAGIGRNHVAVEVLIIGANLIQKHVHFKRVVPLDVAGEFLLKNRLFVELCNSVHNLPVSIISKSVISFNVISR